VLLTAIFNADPHPGNVLILADGTLGQIDFGSAGRLHAAQRLAPARLLLASTARMRSYCSIAWPNAAAR
jgi:ubiquinone biosynthesis protein